MPFRALMEGISHLDGCSPKMDLSASQSFPHPCFLSCFSLFPLFLLQSPLLRDLILIPVSLMASLATSLSGFSVQVLFSFYIVNAFAPRTSHLLIMLIPVSPPNCLHSFPSPFPPSHLWACAPHHGTSVKLLPRKIAICALVGAWTLQGPCNTFLLKYHKNICSTFICNSGSQFQ